jgi:hypothetical protein
MLDQKSFEALRLPPLPSVGAIRFAADFSPEEIGQSAVARNALILLHFAAVGPGLKLTTTGNLSRSVVAEMCDLFTWPGFDKTEAFQFHKVINEPDFLPLYFVRHLVETAGLVRQRKGYLKTTPAGRQVSEDPARQALQALSTFALWEIDLTFRPRPAPRMAATRHRRSAVVVVGGCQRLGIEQAADPDVHDSDQRSAGGRVGHWDHGDGSKDSSSAMVVWTS